MKKSREFPITIGMRLKRKSWKPSQAVDVVSNPEIVQGDFIFGARDMDALKDSKPIYFYAAPRVGDYWVRV